MNVIDSSCWIEYAVGSLIGEKMRPLIENVGELIVPSITIYEVYRKLAAEKSEGYAALIADYMESGKVIDLDSKLSVFAAQTARTHKLAMADAIVYATVLRYRAVLWTADKHFKELADVRYFDNAR
jgi:predicted nucleic acid-binding protein